MPVVSKLWPRGHVWPAIHFFSGPQHDIKQTNKKTNKLQFVLFLFGSECGDMPLMVLVVANQKAFEPAFILLSTAPKRIQTECSVEKKIVRWLSRNAVPMWTIFLSAEAQVVACSRQDCPLTLCVQRSSSYLSSEAFSCSRKPAFPWRARETEWGPKSHRLWPASSPLSLEVWLLMKQNNSRLALLLFDDDSMDMVDTIQWSPGICKG